MNISFIFGELHRTQKKKPAENHSALMCVMMLVCFSKIGGFVLGKNVTSISISFKDLQIY